MTIKVVNDSGILRFYIITQHNDVRLDHLCLNLSKTTGWTGCIICTCKKVIFSIFQRRKRVTAAFKTSDKFCLQRISTFSFLALLLLQRLINYKICFNFSFVLHSFYYGMLVFLSIFQTNWKTIKHEQMFNKYWFSMFSYTCRLRLR